MVERFYGEAIVKGLRAIVSIVLVRGEVRQTEGWRQPLTALAAR